MQRREFLVRLGGVVIAVPAVLELVGCGDDSPANPNNAVSYDVPSSSDNGHTHRITVLCSDLTAGAEVPYRSTSTDHFHDVTLSVMDIQTIVAGGQVTKTSTSGGGSVSPHTHNWTIRTPAGAC